MTPSVEAKPQDQAATTDLVEAIRAVLAASDEPLTPAKIRAALPAPYRAASPEELADCLSRQVSAQVFFQYPRYRSQHDRYWDRPMRVHIAVLLREVVKDGPLPLFELRRRLPAYAGSQAEEILRDQLRQGALHRHPPLAKRASERFGVTAPDAREYLRPELTGLFRRMGELGFTREQVRIGALELLHDEQWAEEPGTPAEAPAPGPEARAWSSHTEAPSTSPHRPPEPAHAFPTAPQP